jgi:putative flippase GtrA
MYVSLKNLSVRGARYSIGGISTFLIDLGIVLILTTYTSIHTNVTLVLGFAIGITINYFFSYFWAFKGTSQTLLRGYFYFLIIGICTGVIISYTTTSLMEISALSLLIARTIVATFAGLINFLLNTFFNFKVI